MIITWETSNTALPPASTTWLVTLKISDAWMTLKYLVTDCNSDVPLSKVLALGPEARQIWDFSFRLEIGRLGIYIRFRQCCIAPEEATTENTCPTKEK